MDRSKCKPLGKWGLWIVWYTCFVIDQWSTYLAILRNHNLWSEISREHNTSQLVAHAVVFQGPRCQCPRNLRKIECYLPMWCKCQALQMDRWLGLWRGATKLGLKHAKLGCPTILSQTSRQPHPLKVWKTLSALLLWQQKNQRWC